MASTNFTSHLSLNQWLGEDKPKRSDFNNDNKKVDDGYYRLEQSLMRHAGDAALHVSATEKEKWSKGQPLQVTTYQGTGAESRTLSLGGSPEFALVMAIGRGPVQHVDDTNDLAIYSGVASPQGCSQGLALVSNGIRLSNAAVGDFYGNKIRLNESGVSYLCFHR